ncbi:Pre-mRNA-splicing regulator WTAP [Nymphon striatum]|nr:Pre-mRNA-splicing regulator WTAP [Nymphon striatum]KAG1682520.1 Pre-mRNA-splicing regulator WTAP [Nymphon striatum]
MTILKGNTKKDFKERTLTHRKERKLIVKVEKRDCNYIIEKCAKHVFLRHLWRTEFDRLRQKLSKRVEAELVCLRESEEKLKQQQIEATRRENVLVMRLTTKEQEMQEYINQIQELKQSQMPSVSQLRSTLTDPAVNLLFEGVTKELKSTQAKLEETQNELSAWKFTPDSNTGKRLMAKCRLLYQENEELGKAISSGKIAKLEGDLALQKNFCDELRKSQSEMEDYLEEVEEEVEGMQSTILFLQNQLREHKEKQIALQEENSKLSSILPNSNLSCDDQNLRTSTDSKDCGNKIKTNGNSLKSKTSDHEAEENACDNHIKIVNNSKNNLQNINLNNSIQNGDCVEKDSIPNEHTNTKDNIGDNCSASDLNDEPMDTSTTSEKINDQSLSGENRTPNDEDSSSKSRTTKNNHEVDIDTEVQVAQTLAAWANCGTDSDKVSSLKSTSSSEKLSSDSEKVTPIIQNNV